MFEGFVASIFNKWLGKYVKDLDTEHLNIGIFSGEVRLNNLCLKPEALFELELPIEVKHGVIGVINIIIPWTSLSSQAIVINVEDVLIVCAPIGLDEFSLEKEKRLVRAMKKKILDDLEGENFLGCGPGSLFDGILTALTNNVHILIRKIHVRYEDEFSGKGIACGLCIESLSMETTNSKWKPCLARSAVKATTVYQLAKLEAASVYFNTEAEKTNVLNENWRQDLKEGLQTFRIKGESFDFVVKPFNAKMKAIVGRPADARAPKLLVDLVVHDIVCNLSRSQLYSILEVLHKFHQIHLRREFLSFRPLCGVHGKASLWWKYFNEAVLRQRVRPYQWKNIQRHRLHYHEYKNLYRKVVLNPGDTELRLDLARAEDSLPLSSIIIAREHGKLEIRNEDPDRMEIISSEEKWWTLNQNQVIKFQVRAEKPRGIWAQLSPSEKQTLSELRKIDFDNTSPEKRKKYIEHKVNLTIHHFCGSLFVRGTEIASIALGQFLANFETRPAAEAFKLSARAEHLAVEGASIDQGLVPLVNVVPATENSPLNFFSVEFEKNPLSVEADYGIVVNLEQLEVFYHEHAFSQFLNFFQGVGITQNYLKENFSLLWDKIRQIKLLIESRQLRVDVDLSIKAPHFVIAESGTFQKSGSLMVVGLGKWTVHTALQPPLSLEDVTQMELEERLYDRLHVNLDGFQVLFCDSGDKWRESLEVKESKYHIVSKVRGQIVSSSSIKPDYKLLPKSKLNISLYNVKMNLSDRKIVMLLDFFEGLPLPSSNTVSVTTVLLETDFKNDIIQPDVELDLHYIKNLVVSSELSRQRTPDNSEILEPNLGSIGGNWSSVEVSDEDVELWAKTVDLPGFDDNISPNNVITSLLRVMVGEIVFVLSRSSNALSDRPYLMARITKCQLDTAFMNYGPAIQATLGGIQLIDKFCIGPSGECLEIVSTQSDVDFISLLYRKVRSNCPDFKTHFHSVEQSLVLDIGVLALTIHREAILTFTKYLQYLRQKIAHREIFNLDWNEKYLKFLLEKFDSGDSPPIPPGAIKFSYSTHLTEFRLKLCDTELEFLELKIKRFESDCMFKANERMVLRAYLSYISLNDLSEIATYPKIISVEEDKVLEVKYVRHSPRFCKGGLGSDLDQVQTDGSFKLNLERIHLVFTFKMMADAQNFIEPLISIGAIRRTAGFLRRSFTSRLDQLRGWNARLRLSLTFHFPVLLIPRKSHSPDLFVLDLGELNVENFFKKILGFSSREETPNVIDNILLKLESASLSRASMTLTGRMEILENVLEPIRAKFDVKRFVGGPKVAFKGENGSKFREIPLFEIYGNVESVKISFGPNDLSAFLSLWKDDFGSRRFSEISRWWKALSPMDGRNPTEKEDLSVRKLEAFLSQGEACRIDTVGRFAMDSLTIDLYQGEGEILSSPVRDLNRGLCRLTLSEGSAFLEKFYDGSMEMKMALQTCLLEDIRTDPSVVVKRVFQSHQGKGRKVDEPISISTPPFVDVTFKQTSTEDRCIDVLVEKTRLNLSASFVAALAKFAMDSVPVTKNDGGIVNHGYVGDLGYQRRASDDLKCLRPPLRANIAGKQYSSGPGLSCASDDQCGISVSLQCRKPEVIILSSGRIKTSAIVFRCELLMDWSKHPGRDALVVTLAGLQAWSKSHPDPTSTKHDPSDINVLLSQCDVEMARNAKNSDDGLVVTVLVSPIELRLSVLTIATIAEIIQEMRTLIGAEDEKNSNHPPPTVCDLEDLWSPKKISCNPEANICAVGTEPLLPPQPSFSVGRPAESLTVRIPKIEIVLDVPQGAHKRRPLFLTKSSFNLTAYDWSSSINLRGELQIQAAYFNEDIGVWEPFIEPCNNEANGQRRPWEFVFQVFQGKSFPISPHVNLEKDRHDEKERKVSNRGDEPEESETSGDESDEGFTFLRRQNFEEDGKNTKRQNFSLDCGESSDSEGEDGALEKLTDAVGRLFTGGNSDEELTESVGTSGTDDEEVEDQEVETEEETGSTRSTNRERAVFLKKHFDSLDSVLEAEAVERLAVHVLLHSKERLEITVTPISVKVLQEISNAFCGSPSLPIASLDDGISVKNSLGLGSVVTLLSKTDSSAETPVIVAYFDRPESPPSSPNSFSSIPSSKSDFESDLDGIDKPVQKEKLSPVFQYPKEPISKLYDRVTENRLLIQVPGFKDLKVVASKISCSKLYTLQPGKNQTRYHIVVTTSNQSGCRKYVIRSPLQVHNCTSYAMEIYYKKTVIESLGEKIIGEAINPFEDFIRLAVIEPDDILNVPLFVAYHCKLHVLPAHLSSYQASENGISWQEMISDVGIGKDLLCPSKQEADQIVFSIRAYCEENVKSSDSQRRSLPNCLIRLTPPLTVFNYLPYAIEMKLTEIKSEFRIEAGDKINFYYLNLQKPQKVTIEIPNYLGIHWTGSFNLMSDSEEKVLSMVTEQETDGGNKQLSLSLLISKNPSVTVRVYSSYWVINKTELPLQIRGSLVECIHEWSGDGPLLFGFRKQKRRCVRLRAFSSSWSSAFSLDTPGCSGLITCKDKERKRRYRILVQTRLSQVCPKFTKIISFLPNFTVTNFSKKHLRFMEDNERADLWIDIAPGQCLPFWPETDSMKMFVKFRDSKHISQHFPITTPHTTVLRMDKGCGLTVEVVGTVDLPFSIRFQNYKPGDAPVRIDNQCEDLFLKFRQKESGQVVLLSPYQSLLYTWDDPSKERTLLWNVYNSKKKDFCVPLSKDGFGEEKVSFQVICRSQLISNEASTAKFTGGPKRLNESILAEGNKNSSSDDDSEEQTEKSQIGKKTRRDKIIVYWESYLSDRQRVLLLTQDERLAKRVKKSLDAERSHLELFVSVAGLGVSLVDRNKQEIPRELSYISLTDSAAHWEVTVAHRWKTVALELASWLEDRYQQGLAKAQIKDYIHIDFEKMQMTKPFFGELRRRHRPAIWIQYRRSKHMSLFHFQLHRLQVDNQIHDSDFPTVFCPLPNRTDSSKQIIRPAFEIAYLKKHSQSCRDVFKFAKFIVQEHRIQIEKFWMTEMIRFFGDWWGEGNPSAKTRQDISFVHMPISAISTKGANDGENKNMFEYLHCSPIKLQIEFSSQADQDCSENYSSPLIDYFLFTLAPSFAQVKSITVKLCRFDIIGQVCNKNHVWNQGLQHYKSQLWQQLHVLVMGINVLTNPYSQIFLHLSDGSHLLFYEPYLESTGVPEEEFSDGIGVGALGLLGHETGGRLGTATLFAALLGTALQTVIRPDDSRRSAAPPGTKNEMPESITRLILSSRNFSAACPLALSGVVMRQYVSNGPLQGAENFFKGPGKGLWDLMTKSTGGVFDCVAMIRDGVKRAVEMGENVISRVRHPRYVNSILGLRPYSDYEARGLTLLKILRKGLYSNDLYWAHAALTPESKTILLITLQHIFLIGKYKCWSAYELIWALRMDDLMTVPTIQDEKLMFSIRQEENSPGAWNEEKSATSSDKQLLQWLKSEIEAALVLSMEDKPCL